MFKNILIPIDGSSRSHRPVAAAIDMAKVQQGNLVLVSIAAPRLFNASNKESLHDGEVVEYQNVRIAQSALAQAVEAASRAGVTCEPVVVQSGAVCDEITAIAEQRNCDAIFMATRGKMGILDAIFDESTTLKVLQKSTVPVLVFP